jgi:hypothetical protein
MKYYSATKNKADEYFGTWKDAHNLIDGKIHIHHAKKNLKTRSGRINTWELIGYLWVLQFLFFLLTLYLLMFFMIN